MMQTDGAAFEHKGESASKGRHPRHLKKRLEITTYVITSCPIYASRLLSVLLLSLLEDSAHASHTTAPLNSKAIQTRRDIFARSVSTGTITSSPH